MMDKAQVKYQKGEIYLCQLYGIDGYVEVEIIEISKPAKMLKTDYDGWIEAAKFHEKVRGKIGVAKYKRGFFGVKRMVILD